MLMQKNGCCKWWCVWEELDKEAEALPSKHGKVCIVSGPVIQHPKHPWYGAMCVYVCSFVQVYVGEMAHISNVPHDCRWLDGMSGTILDPVNLFRIFSWSEGKPCALHAKLYIINKKTVRNREKKIQQ